MIRSMTGFGQAKAESENYHIRIEIKSLNGKYLDLNMRMPRSLNSREVELRQLFGGQLKRGSITVNIYLEDKGADSVAMKLNEDLARKYYRELEKLADDMQADKTGLFRTVSQMPEVFTSSEDGISDADFEAVCDCFKQAVEQLDQYRIKEGQELQEYLRGHSKKIGAELLPSIAEYDASRREEVRTRLRSGLDDLVKQGEMDEGRFEQELLYYLEKYDITEEKNRLKSHCDLFNQELEGNCSGKKLGFISQEMGREINTMGSKAYYAPVQRIVIDMKEELEMIKEQVLNVL